ncbi:MAG: hypothetical protein JWQ76_5514 [Ramlibacter sp.]|nr:hypothetical protein [Ramlibacter sp.]
MELTGERQLTLPRASVWQALNDPAILKRCLPGCESFEPDGDDAYKVSMTAAVGPIRARFSGRLRLLDLRPQESYSLTFEGSGGAAGFGKGTAQVALTDGEAGQTRLGYSVNAQVGGKLAQVGNRLINGVAIRMADDFFNRFSREIAPQAAVHSHEARADAATRRISPPTAPSAAPQPLQVRGSWTTVIPVLAAAVSVLGAAVSVLAAAFLLLGH